MHTQIGHYQIVGELGRGGMGVVYKGYETALQRHVAIKLMSEALAHQPEVVERFLREARAMGQLSDPHIVQIYYIGEHAGQPFFAMEFVEGETLAERLRREGRIEPQEAAGLLMQAAQGLAVAHERGVIHRDIKPANLMLTRRGLLKVTDFGIALAQRDVASKLTGTGQFVGTPGYLSPEVCLGHPIDARSDIFALGIVFFEMLAGRLPFTDASPLGMMLEVVQSSIPDIRTINASVPAELVVILQRMLEKEAARRYPDCEALIGDLQAAGARVRRTATAAGVAGDAASLTPAPVTPGLASTLPAAPLGPPTLPASTPPTLPSARPVPPSPRPQAAPPAGAPRRSLAAFAVAGVLVLVSAGVVAGLYRDRIGQWMDRDARPVAGAVAEPRSATSGNSRVRTPDAAPERVAAMPAPVPAPDPGTGTVTEASPVVTSAAQAAEAGAGIAVEAPSEAGGSTATATEAQLAEMRRLAAELAEQTEAAKRAQAELEAARTAKASPASTPVRTELAQAPAAREPSVPRAAAGRPAAPALPPMPAVPQVAVVAFGDPMLARAAELAVQNALQADGIRVFDSEQLRGIGRLQHARTPPVADLTDLARRNGIAGLVVVRINDLGRQTLNFYGQSAEVTSATVELAVHDVVARSNLRRSVSETIQYTPLNANDRAREAVGPQLDGVLLALAPYRRRG